MEKPPKKTISTLHKDERVGRVTGRVAGGQGSGVGSSGRWAVCDVGGESDRRRGLEGWGARAAVRREKRETERRWEQKWRAGPS